MAGRNVDRIYENWDDLMKGVTGGGDGFKPSSTNLSCPISALHAADHGLGGTQSDDWTGKNSHRPPPPFHANREGAIVQGQSSGKHCEPAALLGEQHNSTTGGRPR